MPVIRLPDARQVLGVVPGSTIEAAEALTSAMETTFAGGETMDVGTWEAQAHELPIEPYPSTEVIVVISGSFQLVSPDGKVQTFSAGEACVITQGTRVGWRQTGPCRKFYVEIMPPPTSKL